MTQASKPQAVSHMFWFFLLPTIGFMLWASFKLLNGSLHPQPHDVFSRIQAIEKARSAGDRWQSAYALSQELQQLIHDHKLEAMGPQKLDDLYARLEKLLETHSTDARLKRYLLLTLGQMGDARGLGALEKATEDKDPEVRFFAAWGLIDVLGKNPGANTPALQQKIAGWLGDNDPALRKISASFLAQQQSAHGQWLPAIRKQLKDQNVEVRWNAAVALGSVGDKSSVPTLEDMFNLQSLRAIDMKSAKDLQQLLAAGYSAAKKLGDPAVLAAAEKLRGQVNPATPEGRAVAAALR